MNAVLKHKTLHLVKLIFIDQLRNLEHSCAIIHDLRCIVYWYVHVVPGSRVRVCPKSENVV